MSIKYGKKLTLSITNTIIIKYDFPIILKMAQIGSSFVVSEQMEFLKFIKRKSTSEMDCPYCGGTMLPLDLKN